MNPHIVGAIVLACWAIGMLTVIRIGRDRERHRVRNLIRCVIHGLQHPDDVDLWPSGPPFAPPEETRWIIERLKAIDECVGLGIKVLIEKQEPVDPWPDPPPAKGGGGDIEPAKPWDRA